MSVGLFIPCYVDQLYPKVGIATVRVLEALDVQHDFPDAQTCCGQPMANTGCFEDAIPLAQRFVEIFSQYEYVVAPSGSCVAMVRHHFDQLIPDTPGLAELKAKTYELCEFIHDVLQPESFDVAFDKQVGLHQSCHGLRELRLGSCSERMCDGENKIRNVLERVNGIRFSSLKRADECCGFGGTFAVSEDAVSVMMGEDRLSAHLEAGTEVLTAGDMSCLMHLEGIIKRHKYPIEVMHVSEILAGGA